MKIDWHIGCSGFHYKEWKDVFYPPNLAQTKWFGYYSSVFDTLELNVTFYRFPQLGFLKKWYDQSPDHFLFSVKGPRLITHYKQFSDCEKLLSDFYGTVRDGLGKKLGPVLFQMPPKYSFSEERLETITNTLDKSFSNIIEFRHASWWHEEVFTQLAKNNISFCGSSFPGLPDTAVVNTAEVYYRFHGVPRLYYSAYTDDQLDKIADAIHGNSLVKKVYVYFNNTAAIAAIENAVHFRDHVNS